MTEVANNIAFLTNTIHGWQTVLRQQFPDESTVPKSLDPFLNQLDEALVYFGKQKTFLGFYLPIPTDIAQPVITSLCGTFKCQLLQDPNYHSANTTISQLAVVKTTLENPDKSTQIVFSLIGKGFSDD